jgi:uncharacterized protein YqiB (DUF1249 family)
MSTLVANGKSVLPSRFAWLMGMCGENYHRLAHLFAPQRLGAGCYRSTVDDHLDVQLQIIEHHPYTIDLDLTYCLRDSETGGLVPSARIRMYRDARMAEVLRYHADVRLERALGPLPPARTVFERRVRRCSFLNRWLEYLAEQGHSIGTLEPAPGATLESLHATA